MFWEEHFDGPILSWITPLGESAEKVSRIYTVERDQGLAYLHARHDHRQGVPSLAPIHFGRSFEDDPPALERVRALRWRWRVAQHPSVTGDPWLDLAAGVYVVIKTPSLFWGGRGFKFGWLAAPGRSDTFQSGLAQIQLRADSATRAWKQEQVDLCALYRKIYGPCEQEYVHYVGVVTDADGTDSVADADYADFELLVDSPPNRATTAFPGSAHVTTAAR